VRARLRPVRDDELPAFVESVFRFYVADLERHAGFTRAEAEKKATSDHANLLPDGKPLDGHHLLVVEDEHGAAIGRVWYADRAPDVFLYAIEIDPHARGHGYGREAMEAFEAVTRERGFQTVWLNVFGGNDVARSLYRSLGYGEASLHMSKRLS
jgi:ribosomal protein S18 acetylase RimI-like enzyme